ncbi:hypothetical protein D3C75_1024090 [compost metagenome]
MTSPPNGRKGSSTGSDPVARMTCSAVMRMGPSAVSTRQVLASENSAQPLMTLTLAFFSRAATPAFSFLTMPSFHSTVLDRSMAGADAVMPSVPSPAALRTVSYLPAAWMMALDGMQPTFRQVPPRPSPPSTSTVSRPSWPQRMPAT